MGMDQLVCLYVAGRGRKEEGDLRIDDADHASLTVLALRAVEPDGLRVVDHDGVCGHLGRAGRDGHEAGPEARHVGLDVVDGLAGLVKG